ncbi:MAG: hypothetical protein ACXWLH_01700 [Candidatus Saccharimonadales bacterium]
MDPINNNYQTYPPTLQPSSRLKILFIITSISFLVILVLAKLLAHHGDGTVIVTTNDYNNSITVVDAAPILSSASNKPAPKLNPKPTIYHSGQKVSIKPGTYFVNVSNDAVSAAQTVEIFAGETKQLTINLPLDTSPPEPVGDVNSSLFSVGSTQLVYLDSRSGLLYKIDGSNRITQTSETVISTVKWADSSFGVGQDSAGTLYIIRGGSVSPLNNLPSIGGNLSPSYAVAPNRDIYLSYGKDVFLGSPNGFKHIYAASNDSLSLEASSDRVAVLETAKDATNKEGSVIVIDKLGKVIKKNDFEADVRWSPSGKYLITINEGPSQVLDTSLKTVAIVPNALPQDVVWQNDSTMFYLQGNSLWEYSIRTGLAKVVSLIAQNQTLVSAYLDSGGNYVYLSSQASSGTDTYFSIYRYGLKGQTASSDAIKLHDHLPWLTDGCFLSLVNFTRPTVSAVQGNSFDDCLTTAKKYVGQYGLEVNKFSYRLSNILPTTPSQ